MQIKCLQNRSVIKELLTRAEEYNNRNRLHTTMGDELSSYRARIGNFHLINLKRKTMKKDNKISSDFAKWWIAATIIAVLLVMGGIERNPGPVKTVEDLDVKLNKITEILSNHANETKKLLEDFDT